MTEPFSLISTFGGTVVGACLAWATSSLTERRQRKRAAIEGAERWELASAIVAAERVPELLRILQESIDVVDGLARAVPDDPETGHYKSDAAAHHGMMRALRLNAPHPAHSLPQSLKDQWVAYAALCEGLVEVVYDDDDDPHVIEHVMIHYGSVQDAEASARDLSDELHRAQRRANEARALLQAVPQ